MQLTAYLDEKECAKIMEASMETGEVITEKGRFQYKLEVPASEDEFSNGLAYLAEPYSPTSVQIESEVGTG